MGLLGKKANPEKYIREAMAVINGVKEPTIEQMRTNPILARAFAQDPSSFRNVKKNKRYELAALKSLSGLQDVADNQGMTAATRARLADINENVSRETRGATDAIIQRAAERGMGGSGLSLVNQMLAAQEGAGRRSRQATQVAADAEQRALEALMESGRIGERMGAQDFEEKSAAARAEDEINRFNTANMQSVEGMNVGQRNATEERNADLYQRDFDNRFGKAQAIAGQYGQLAQAEKDKAARRRQNLVDIGSAVGTVGSMVAGGPAGLAAKQAAEEVAKKKATMQYRGGGYATV